MSRTNEHPKPSTRWVGLLVTLAVIFVIGGAASESVAITLSLVAVGSVLFLGGLMVRALRRN